MKRLAGVLIAVAGLLLFSYGAHGQANAQGTDDPAQAEAGATVYAASCAGCHGDEGNGSDRGRPLVGIAGQGDRATHITSVTDGKGGMPAFGERLSAEEIEQAISFVRLTFVEEAAEATETADADDTGALAETGVGSTGLAIIGITMLIGGMQLVVFGKNEKN